jgi:hypothetical protein
MFPFACEAIDDDHPLPFDLMSAVHKEKERRMWISQQLEEILEHIPESTSKRIKMLFEQMGDKPWTR